MQFRPGYSIRDYKIEKLIGRGGFAHVYLARQQLIDRKVALKVILPEFANNPEFITRFNAEAQFIARIEHPHIVPLYEYWLQPEGAFLAMRWMDGGTLKTHIKTEGMTLRRFVRMVQQVGAALQVAHDAKIIHRDLKPDNVMFDQYGNAYLTDFGIAKDTSEEVGLTKADSVLGTPSYLAPEQVLGDPVTAQSDIYNFGILMFETLTGHHPWEGASTAHMLRKQINEPLPIIKLDDYDLALQLNNILQQATAKTPSIRYRKISDVVTEIDKLMSALPESRREQVFYGSDGGGVQVEEQDENRTLEINATAFSASLQLMGDLKASVYRRAASVFKRPRKLIGRDDLVARIQQLIDAAEPVLIHGTGGLGKTSLVATVVANRLKDKQNDAFLWLEAGALDATHIFDALAAALDAQADIANLTGDARITAMRDLLDEHSIPLVLDDVWNDQALFQVMKAIPFGLPVIVTSRSRIPIDGEMIDIGLLSAEDALELLGYHARSDLRTNDAARRLCERLGNHTFAVELAGKNLRLDGLEKLGTFLEKVSENPHNIAAPGQYADIGRQSIEDLLKESYVVLQDQTQQVLMALGGMKSLVTSTELIAELMQTNTALIAKQFAALEQRGLLQLEDHGAYQAARVHELTYSFARNLYRYSPFRGKVPAAIQRFVETHKENYTLLEAEQRNILGLMQQRSINAEIRVDVMRNLVMEGYLTMRGHNPEFVVTFDAAIHDARYTAELELQHHFLSKRGNISRDLGNWQQAIYYYRQALEIAVKEGLKDREVILSCVLANAFLRTQDTQEANTYLERGEKLARELDDNFLKGYVIETQGFAAQHHGDMGKAATYFAEGVKLARADNDEQGLYYMLLNLGTAQSELSNTETAITTLSEALELARKHGHNAAIAEILESLGMLHHALGQSDDASRKLHEALDVFTKAGMSQRADSVQTFLDANYAVS